MLLFHNILCSCPEQINSVFLPDTAYPSTRLRTGLTGFSPWDNKSHFCIKWRISRSKCYLLILKNGQKSQIFSYLAMKRLISEAKSRIGGHGFTRFTQKKRYRQDDRINKRFPNKLSSASRSFHPSSAPSAIAQSLPWACRIGLKANSGWRKTSWRA